jgi:SAM-dependent methyltransferase
MPLEDDDTAEYDDWGALAAEWSAVWAAQAGPVYDAVIAASGVATGSRVLDVGCGSGELLRAIAAAGALASGVDPSPGMVEFARSVAPGADVRRGEAQRLPWPDGSFDVVTAVNALQFADDTVEALAEFARVLVPGGIVAVANWAEGALNDLDVVEAAIAEPDDFVSDAPDDGDLRVAGALETLLTDAALDVLASGLIEVPWVAADGDALVRGVLLGEGRSVVRELAPAVLAAAERFRTGDGYRLVNHYRFAIARTRF